MTESKVTFTNRIGKQQVIDFDEVQEWVKDRKHIQLIKLHRDITGGGLKECKDTVDDWLKHSIYNSEYVVERFAELVGAHFDPYTKEEFMRLIENAIDNMEVYHFTDMIDAVETMLTNVKKNGGLERLAKERDKFLNNI